MVASEQRISHDLLRQRELLLEVVKAIRDHATTIINTAGCMCSPWTQIIDVCSQLIIHTLGKFKAVASLQRALIGRPRATGGVPVGTRAKLFTSIGRLQVRIGSSMCCTAQGSHAALSVRLNGCAVYG
jgi:hypothetical protein